MPPPFPSSPPAPIVRDGATTTWLLAAAASLTALVLGLLTLLLLGLSTGPLGLVGGIVLAVLPLPVYVLLALWIDRFEKEPVWMLAAAFLWGATAAVFFAFILNTLFEAIMSGSLGAGAPVATAVLSAPFVEELAKGFALVIFFLWKRDEFDNVLDGIIYATMVGLGFAMTENILYYGKALAAGGLGASLVTFVLRGVVSPFAHPLFTSMTGIGLGLARQAPRGSWLKMAAPAAGICAAMFLHFLWNFSASLGAMFFLAYVIVMVPAFLGLITMAIVSLRQEGRIIREHLLPELRNGLLPEREYHALCTVGGRIGGAWRAFGSGGWAERRRRLRLQDLASELAFHRWRTARGIFPRRETPAARESRYIVQLQALGTQLGWKPVVLPPPLPLAIPPAGCITRAPRSGGFRGVLIAVGSLGCLGVITVGTIGLGLLLLAAGQPGGEAPVPQTHEALEKTGLASLIPPRLGEFKREGSAPVDSDTLAMVGAVEGLVGDYSSGMVLLLLRYRSPELAASATEPLRAALCPKNDGWQIAPRGHIEPAHRFDSLQSGTGKMASLWNYGSLVLVFWGDAVRMEQFVAPDEIVAASPAAGATR